LDQREASVTDFEIRKESPSERARVDDIHVAAFGRTDEARLVRSLRAKAQPQLSLVAAHDGELVGHVFFSPVEIVDPGPSTPSAGLAPLAVAPEKQGWGVGSALVRAGLRDCISLGWQAVFLLGDPAYYSRFGFSLAARVGLRYESEAFDPAFQVLELVPGALLECSGWVQYDEAFSEV
jgi:putative acetyltransferase